MFTTQAFENWFNTITGEKRTFSSGDHSSNPLTGEGWVRAEQTFDGSGNIISDPIGEWEARNPDRRVIEDESGLMPEVPNPEADQFLRDRLDRQRKSQKPIRGKDQYGEGEAPPEGIAPGRPTPVRPVRPPEGIAPGRPTPQPVNPELPVAPGRPPVRPPISDDIRPEPVDPGPRPPFDPDPDMPYPMPGPWPGCPTPDQQILLADKSLIFAGELQVGDKVHTMHEKTFKSGNHEVTHVSIIDNEPVYLVKFSDDVEIRCSATHKLFSEDKEDWVEITALGSGERVSLYDGEVSFISAEHTGEEKVVRITVKGAHTYICEGLLSHNKTPPLPPREAQEEMEIKSMYENMLGREADEEGFNYWLDQVRTGQQSLDQVAENIRNSPEAQKYKSRITQPPREEKPPINGDPDFQPPRDVPFKDNPGVGDEEYRKMSITYENPDAVDAETHRRNQKDMYDRVIGPLKRYGTKREAEKRDLKESIPSRPPERKKEAIDRTEQYRRETPIDRDNKPERISPDRTPPSLEGGRPATKPNRPAPQPKSDWLEDAYQSNLGRSADQGGKDYWTQEVESGRSTKEEVIANIRRSDEYKNRSR